MLSLSKHDILSLQISIIFMKIILSGGGTGGPVSPLIAIYQEIKKRQPQADFLWVGTKSGPEAKMVSSYGINFQSISSGKLRRYFSWQNFFDPILIFIGFIQSFFIILKYKPNLIMSAGGFVAVPVALAAWILKKPVIIHQQDIRTGLANKIMTPLAKVITVSFAKSLKDFPQQKTSVVGNPVRQEILQGNKKAGLNFLGFDENLPVVLVMGGGTGASFLNQLVEKSISELIKFCQVVHLTGSRAVKEINDPRYKKFEFLTKEIKDVFAASDLAVTRGGMATLTEFAALAKPTLIIPMPGQQEENANEFFKNNAAAVIKQQNLNPENFVTAIKELLDSPNELETFRRNMPKVLDTKAAERIVNIIL